MRLHQQEECRGTHGFAALACSVFRTECVTSEDLCGIVHGVLHAWCTVVSGYVSHVGDADLRVAKTGLISCGASYRPLKYASTQIEITYCATPQRRNFFVVLVRNPKVSYRRISFVFHLLHNFTPHSFKCRRCWCST